jgi:hypothetical protein
MRVLVREAHKLSIRFEPVGALLAGVLCGGIGAMAIMVRLDVILSIFGVVFLGFAALCISRMRFVILTINLQTGQVVVQRWGVRGADQEQLFPVSTFIGLKLNERQHTFNGESEGSSYRLLIEMRGGECVPVMEDFDFDRKNKLAAVNAVQEFLNTQQV